MKPEIAAAVRELCPADPCRYPTCDCPEREDDVRAARRIFRAALSDPSEAMVEAMARVLALHAVMRAGRALPEILNEKFMANTVEKDWRDFIPDTRAARAAVLSYLTEDEDG